MGNLEALKEKIRNRQIFFGTSVNISDPCVTEIFVESGFAFVWVELEHSQLDRYPVYLHILAARGSQVPVFVRMPDTNPANVKSILDMGASGIIFPLIKNRQDAETAISSCRYPPNGIRGFGPRRAARYGFMDMETYLKRADSDVWVLLMIEHIEAVNNLDDILSVPGIDGLVLGPCDLSSSMGLIGQMEHVEVRRTVDKVIEKAGRKGIPIGVSIAYDPAAVRAWLGRGISWMELSGDLNFLAQSSRRCLQEANNLLAEKEAGR